MSARPTEGDPSGMYQHMAALGTEFAAAWRASAGLDVPPGPYSSVIVAGMGGSAAGGDYLAAIADVESSIPVHVVRGYTLPHYAAGSSLVVVVSYSGQTREAKACYRATRQARASVVVITRGGELGRLAAADGVLIHHISYDSPPRASLAHVLAPLLRIGNKVGATHITDAAVCEAADAHANVMAEIGREVHGSANPARSIAADLLGKWPVMFAAEHLSGVTRRTRNQLAENAKMLSGFEPMPEAAHNFVVGLEASPELALMAPLSFESPCYSEPVQRGFDVLAEVCREAGSPLARVRARGVSLLADMLEMTAWGDCLSYYLAELQGIDPTPTKTLDVIKSRMQPSAELA